MMRLRSLVLTMAAVICVVWCVVIVGAIAVGIAYLAPRTTPEAERAQRVTAPWLTGERR